MSANPKSSNSAKSFAITPYKQININREMFEELCRIQCTEKEIAAVFRVSPDTISRWCQREYQLNFAAIKKQFSEDGKACLRRLQVKWAEKNPTMCLWLGKQWLGQADKVEVEHTVKTDLERAQELLIDLRNTQGIHSDYPENMQLSDSQIYEYGIKPRFPDISPQQLQIEVPVSVGSKGDEDTEPA